MAPSNAWFTLTLSVFSSSYPFNCWASHLRRAYPTIRLRHVLALFIEKTLQRWVSRSEYYILLFFATCCVTQERLVYP
ncbi:hypothetical protein DFH29DRAFT_902369, partial [Suillus ampliporus]